MLTPKDPKIYTSRGFANSSSQLQEEPRLKTVVILTPRSKARELMQRYRSRRWSIKKLVLRRFSQELMQIEQRELFASSVKNSGEVKSIEQLHSRLKTPPDPNDLRKSLYSVNPEVYQLAKEEMTELASEINRRREANKLKSIDLAILKNEVFQRLKKTQSVSSSAESEL